MLTLLISLILFFSVNSYAKENVQGKDDRPEFKLFDIEKEVQSTKAANLDDAVIFDRADSLKVKTFEEEGITEVHLLGSVRILMQENYLEGNQVIITFKDDQAIEVRASGSVEFFFQDATYLAEEIYFLIPEQEGLLYDARSFAATGEEDGKEMGWFYTADKITFNADNEVTVYDGVLTTSDRKEPYFQVAVKRMWIRQNKIVHIYSMTYIAGQAKLFWLPFMTNRQGGTGIRSIIGRENTIGYYMLNYYTYESPYGDLDLGFDMYERMGEYFVLDFEKGYGSGGEEEAEKEGRNIEDMGWIDTLEVKVETASDVRVIKDGNRYSQYVDPNADGNFQTIRDFSWAYNFDIEIEAPDTDLSLEIESEYLNDPFFQEKYAYRENFEDKTAINWISIFLPQFNSWFDYDGDETPNNSSINQQITLEYEGLTIESSWTMTRIGGFDIDEDVNKFENEYYSYKTTTRNLLDISYDSGEQEIFSYQKTSPYKQVLTTENETYNLSMDEDYLDYFDPSEIEEVEKDVNEEVTDEEGNTDILTFKKKVKEPTVFYNLNTYTRTDIDITADWGVKFQYTPTENFGSNETAWVKKADEYIHEEDAYFDFDMSFYNSIFYWDQTISAKNYSEMTSFDEEKEEADQASYAGLYYDTAVGIYYNETFNEDTKTQFEVPFMLSYQTTIPLVELYKDSENNYPSLYQTVMLETGIEGLQDWEGNSLLGLSLDASYSTTYRLPKEVLPEDNYIDNHLEERVSAGLEAKVWWFSMGVEFDYNLLDKVGDPEPGTEEDLYYRFSNGYPTLNAAFTPSETYEWIPSLEYAYDMLEGESLYLDVNQSLFLRNFIIPWMYPVVYDVAEIGLSNRFYYDFIEPRNSFLEMTFVVGFHLTEHAKISFMSRMKNEKIYLYLPDSAGARLPGEERVNFFKDLWNGLQFWNTDALLSSNFKMKGLSIVFEHDLDDWELVARFDLNRKVDDYKNIAYWEPAISLLFTLKGLNTGFPEIERKLVPPEYQ